MVVKVEKFSSKLFWYSNNLNEIFKVVGEGKNYYVIRYNNINKGILKKDCKVIPEKQLFVIELLINIFAFIIAIFFFLYNATCLLMYLGILKIKIPYSFFSSYILTFSLSQLFDLFLIAYFVYEIKNTLKKRKE